MGFLNHFVPVDLPTHRWVNSPMVTILLDFHTSLISLHDLISQTFPGLRVLVLCASIRVKLERIFFHLAYWTETKLITDKLLTIPPTCCLIFDTLLWPDTKSAEVRDQLLLPWVGFGLASWGRNSNSSWSHDGVVGICFLQSVRWWGSAVVLPNEKKEQTDSIHRDLLWTGVLGNWSFRRYLLVKFLFRKGG